MRRRSAPAVLRSVLEEREKRNVALRRRRVSGRNTDGSLVLVGYDQECVERGPEAPYYPGQILELPADPQFRSFGTAGIAVATATGGGASLVLIDSVTPREVPIDDGVTITIDGFGFRPGLAVTFLDADGEPNADLTVGTPSVLDSHTIEVEVSADPGATPLTGGAVVVGPTTLPDAYDVAAPPPAPESFEVSCGSVIYPNEGHVYWVRTRTSETRQILELARLPVSLMPPASCEAGVVVAELAEIAIEGGGGGGA